MVDKALVHFAISRLDRGTVVIHVLPAGFCQDDVIPKVSHLRSASKVLNACTYCSNSFISLVLEAGNVGSSVNFLDHAVDEGKVKKWLGVARTGVRPLSDIVYGVLLYQDGVHIHNDGGPAAQWVCCKSPDAKWGLSTSMQRSNWLLT